MGLYSNGTLIVSNKQVVGGLDLPTWNTPAGSIGTVYHAERADFTTFIPALSATSPSGSTVSYTIISGSLPSGLTLNTNGTWSGTPAAVATDQTYTFQVSATSTLNAARTFTLTIKAPIVTTFAYTGADQTFVVPTGRTRIMAKLWGAAGGGGYGEGYSDLGGPGGFTDVTRCVVTSGDTLLVQVGQGGWHTNGSNGPLSSTRPYPWGGRPSPRSTYNTGYGGGRSAIFKSNSVSAINCLAVAGGGGGAGGKGWSGTWPTNANKGGAGGGTEGRPGWFLNSSSSGINTGTGGTQSGIGVSGWGVSGAGVEAAQFKGGDNANPEGTYPDHGGNTGGGGGDGWYGGRASPYAHSGAGGGSGYVNSTYATGTLSDSGDGTSTQQSGPSSPPGTSDAYYGASAGVSVNNSTGNNGRIVIIY